MPDVTIKRIDELPAAESIGQNDLFVAEQSSTAKKVTWELIKNSFGGDYDVAFVTYGTATNATIETAYQAGKLVVCHITNNSTEYYLPLIYRVNSTSHYFGGAYRDSDVSIVTASCVGDSWTWNGRTVGAKGTATPSALGTAAVGTSAKYAREDHVHAMPSASDVGAEPAVTEVTVSTAGAVTQALDAGKFYHFTGALTSLTITLNAAASGQVAQYHFDFDSPSTAPTLSLPNSVTMPSGFSVEANKHYEIDILNNYGVVMSWANS